MSGKSIVKKPKGLSKSHLDVLQLRANDLTDLELDGAPDQDLAYELLDYIESFYMTNGYVPSIEKAEDLLRLKPELYKRWITSRPFREKLAKRGVFLPGIREHLPEDLLTQRQLEAIKVITDTHDTRSYKKKFMDMEISTTEWNSWLSDSTFTSVLHGYTERMFSANQYEALLAIIDNTRDGDLASAKLYMEMTGRYSQKNESLNMPLAQVINLIVEIIQDVVKDPDMLNQIGTRMMGVVAAAVQADGNNS